MSELVLYDYWRSSAAYRVRIALNLKGVPFRAVPVDLAAGEQSEPAYLARNPQGLVPALDVGTAVLTQSLAIIDYLDRVYPHGPLLPNDPLARAQVQAMALTIAADIHPIANLRVLNYLRGEIGLEEENVVRWIRHWIAAGFSALEARAPETGWLSGAAPGLADVCLVPQVYNARRFDLPLTPYPRLCRIDDALRQLPAFAAAAPEAVRPG